MINQREIGTAADDAASDIEMSCYEEDGDSEFDAMSAADIIAEAIRKVVKSHLARWERS